MSGRLRRPIVLAAACLILVALFPAGSQGQIPPVDDAEEELCTVDRAHARVFTRENAEGRVLYYGHAIMYTSGCGEWSPGSVTVTFEPVAGAPSACQPQPAADDDGQEGDYEWRGEVGCFGALAPALQGTQMTVTARGERVGVRGGEVFMSSCTLIVPTLHSTSCSFPVQGGVI